MRSLRCRIGKEEGRALLLVPPGAGRRRAVILLHGHFSSPEVAIGIKKFKDYKPIGLELARQGFIVLAPQARYNDGVDLQRETKHALVFLTEGRTLMGERVADVLRYAAYLRGSHDAEARRIGLLGWSMGGMTALYAAALDDRFSVLYISGAFGSLEHLMEGPLQSPDVYVPGIVPFGGLLKVAEMACPRPLFLESFKEDTSMPYTGLPEQVAALKRHYAERSASDNLQTWTYEGPHRLAGVGAVDWFFTRLKGR